MTKFRIDYIIIRRDGSKGFRSKTIMSDNIIDAIIGLHDSEPQALELICQRVLRLPNNIMIFD